MTRPVALEVRIDAIPDVLGRECRWVLWRYEWQQHDGKKGRWTKVLRTTSGRHAKSNELSTWTSCGEAIAAYQAGGFDGIVRDLAGYDDEIPLIGVKNPLGGVNDWALDQLGIDDNEDLPTPNEEYYEGKAFIEGSAGAGAGIGVADAKIKALIEGAGLVKVKTSGENKGDVEFTVRLDGEANANLGVAAFGAGIGGKTRTTATITLDAQNGYAPDKVTFKSSGGYTGTLGLQGNASFMGDDVDDIAKELGKVAVSDMQGEGQGFEFSADLDLKDPQNLQATLDALAGQNPVPLIDAFNDKGTLGFDTYDLSSESTDGSVKVGLGVGGGAGGASSSEEQSDRTGITRPPGGTWVPRVCKQPS